LVNNELIARQKLAIGKYSENLIHAPFHFNLKTFKKGRISAAGFINGKIEAVDLHATPGKPTDIVLDIDESGKKTQSGCNDVVFIYAYITDNKGTTVPNADNFVKFTVEGNLEIIGQNLIKAEAGIAPILIRVGDKPGKYRIIASGEGLNTKTIEIDIK
jgi:beta-galactosidase